MLLTRFTVKRELVTPLVYPFGVKYWLVEEVGKSDHVFYTFLIDVKESSYVYRYWPYCKEVTSIEMDMPDTVLRKRFPEGNERGIVRAQFNYPSYLSVSNVPYPKLVNWSTGNGRGYKTWFICVDSIHQLLELYPEAWCIEIVAEGLLCP